MKTFHHIAAEASTRIAWCIKTTGERLPLPLWSAMELRFFVDIDRRRLDRESTPHANGPRKNIPMATVALFRSRIQSPRMAIANGSAEPATRAFESATQR